MNCEILSEGHPLAETIGRPEGGMKFLLIFCRR